MSAPDSKTDDTVPDSEADPSEAPTVVETPGSPKTSGTFGTFGTLGTAGTAQSPAMVMRRVEIEQTRNTGITGLVFNVVALVAGPLMGGEHLAVQIFMVSAAFAFANNVYRLIISTEERYSETKVFVFIALSTVTNTGIAYHIGVFSPILIIFVVDQYSACLYYRRRVALATLVAGCLPVAFLVGLYAPGILVDPGLLAATTFGPTQQVAFALIYFMLMVTIYTQTLKTREVTVTSLEELDDAVRLASRREALFLEARQDLEQALRAGGLGRFSDQVLGSFKLGAVIGRGGMGEVYEAVHVETGAPAAVKMLLPEVISRPDYVRRFMREVQIAASLSSPHVVEVLEIGDESAPLPYLAMERLHGENLAQILRRERRLDADAVIMLIQQIARGIGAATAAGIIHRDLKPQNLFLTSGPTGVWKILDFGISKLVDGGATLTGAQMLGTPHYMAPEQVGGTVDARADVYGLAAVAYRALTGRQPFVGSDFRTIALDVISKMPVKPTVLVPDMHRDVDLVLAVGLAKEPDDRFTTSHELANALEAALRGRLDSALRRRGVSLLREIPWQTEVAD